VQGNEKLIWLRRKAAASRESSRSVRQEDSRWVSERAACKKPRIPTNESSSHTSARERPTRCRSVACWAVQHHLSGQQRRRRRISWMHGTRTSTTTARQSPCTRSSSGPAQYWQTDRHSQAIRRSVASVSSVTTWPRLTMPNSSASGSRNERCSLTWWRHGIHTHSARRVDEYLIRTSVRRRRHRMRCS